MLWILLLLTPSIVWVIQDSYSQRRYRKNVGKHSNSSANWYLRNSDTFLSDGDSGYGSYYDSDYDGDYGGFDGGDCGDCGGGDGGDCGGGD